MAESEINESEIKVEIIEPPYVKVEEGCFGVAIDMQEALRQYAGSIDANTDDMIVWAEIMERWAEVLRATSRARRLADEAGLY